MKKAQKIAPVLEAFKFHKDIPFSVVDPSNLPVDLKNTLDDFMIGQTVPHDIYIYAHDYELFRQLVRSGQIKIE
ncbi:hypothetical protein [Vibrio brasiliensis]|uniref:hypothetical protein n=1 Tax=Vibrio brasiliensis TaxID=170652 RepID=UPI001EFEC6B6|nr:hypothetical protein [Vibrio brasiliensis]MCG9727874.1 hypothetical protein [Vibrio brasiliensis]